jgi:cell shape-determining protein MreC
VLVIVSGAILISFVDRSLIISPVQRFAIATNSLLTTLFNKPGDWAALFRAKAKLNEDNRFLSEQYSGLSSVCTLAIQSLESDNAELSSALSRRSEDLKSKIIATAFVIGKPPVSPYGSVIIDLGMADKIEVGDIVLVGRYIIGTVESVSQNSSAVKMFGEKGDKRIFEVGEKRLPLHGEGQGGGSYSAEYIKKDEDISGAGVRLADYPEYRFAEVLKPRDTSATKYEVKFVSPVNIYEITSVDIVRHATK